MKFASLVAISALSATAFLATSVTAATVKTTLTGTVTSEFTPNVAGTEVGTAVTFSATYDPDLLTATPISLGGEGPSLIYTGDITAQLTIGANVLTFDTVNITIANDQARGNGPGGRADGIFINYRNGVGPADAFLEQGQIRLAYNPDQFTDASIPAVFPLSNLIPGGTSGDILRPFSATVFEFDSVVFSITGSTTEPVSAVPLPLSGLALITGLGGLGALRRRSRKSA